MQIEINKENFDQFDEWKRSPITKIILSALNKRRVELMEELATGVALFSEYTEQKTAHIVGEIAGINLLLEIESLEEEEK